MKRILFFTLIALPVFLFATIDGTMPGGTPSKKWEEEGTSRDFFVMFNSLIEDKMQMPSEEDNPQGDACMESSSFTLTSGPKGEGSHIPSDAQINEAYIVWMGAVDPDMLDQPTDNTVHLSFAGANDGAATNAEDVELDIQVGDTGKTLDATLPDPATAAEGELSSFNFEGLTYSDFVDIGCSESDDGHKTADPVDLGFFTYRTDITSFFTNLQEKHDPEKISDLGDAVEGTYTVSGLDCTDHEYYQCNTTMVSAWAIMVVYSSQEIGSSKKMYMYTGLSRVQDDISKADVSGFELPDTPIMRLTSMIAEGDPGLFNAQMEEEAIKLMGENGSLPYRLENKCNTNSGGGQGNYEIYNSNSSIVNWNPDATEENQISCVESQASEFMGIDVDTFLLDAGKEVNLQEHLSRGNTTMEVRLSVNQDAIFTNFLIVSVDNKAPAFDIPPESDATMDWDFDREKHFCGCRMESLEDGDIFCNDRPFYYLIKVQNWGGDVAENVRVVDDITGNPKLKYIPGTAEMGTVYNPDRGYFTDWEQIPDKTGTDPFPLSGDGHIVASSMSPCNWDTGECPDSRLIRFKVQPLDPTKNDVIYNTAEIIDEKTGKSYTVNRKIRLTLENDNANCKALDDCSAPDPTSDVSCGGFDVGCTTDADCDSPHQSCENNECVWDVDQMCLQSKILAAEGKNSPPTGNKIVIPPDNNGLPLTLGQFSIDYPSCEESKIFLLNSVVLDFDSSSISSPANIFSEFELIMDIDGNGQNDGQDMVISKPGSTLEGLQVRFEMQNKFTAMPGGQKLHFIARAKVNYQENDIGTSTKFNFGIKKSSNFGIKDNMNGQYSDNEIIEIDGNRMEFATYSFEPTGTYFIMTTGSADPPVPPGKEFNSDSGHAVMHLRTKALGTPNQITSLGVVLEGTNCTYGQHIKKLELYLDNTGDGSMSNLLTSLDTDDLKQNSRVATFPNLATSLAYSAGQQKYLVLKAYFDFDDDSRTSFVVNSSSIELSDPGVEIYDDEVRSKFFDCDGECDSGPGPDPSSCECTAVGISNVTASGTLFALAVMALIGFVSLLLRKRRG